MRDSGWGLERSVARFWSCFPARSEIAIPPPSRTQARTAVLALVVLVGASFSGASEALSRPTSDQSAELTELRKLLSEAQAQLNRHGDIDAALQLLQRAVEQLTLFSQLEAFEQERTRWALCDIQTRIADTVESDADIVYFASSAIECWQNYASWYGNLSETHRATLSSRGQDRIQMATRFQFNCILRRGTRLGSPIEDLFSLYADLPPEYFAAKTVDALMDVLARCPTWAEELNLDFNRIEALVCRRGSCRGHWEAMRDFLEEWKKIGSLSPQRQKIASRWIREIEGMLRCE